MTKKPLNENRWLACVDPKAMLEVAIPQSSERQMRLLACGALRRVVDLDPEPVVLQAIKVAQKYADGLATLPELSNAYQQTLDLQIVRDPIGQIKQSIILAAQHVAYHDISKSLLACLFCCASAKVGEAWRSEHAHRFPPNYDRLIRQREDEFHCGLIRDVFCNPFEKKKPALAPLPERAVEIARSIYLERSFARLRELADVLEEALVADKQILDHLRSRGPHLRGCWALDLVLGQH